MFRLTTLFLALLFFAAPASAQALRDDLWVTNGQGTFTTTILGNTLYLGGLFTRVGPATGGLMPVDATTGVTLLPSQGLDGAINAIVPDGAGGWIVGGSFQHLMGQPRSNLARIDANGALTNWNPGVVGVVKTMAVGGTTLYLGGSFSHVGGLARSNAAAIDLTSGAVSTTWVPNPDNTVHTLSVLNGLVYMGGEYFGVSGTQRAHAGSYDAVTAAATQWQPNTDGTVYAMWPRYDVINLTTTVYVGGSFTVLGGAFRANLGSVDATPSAPTFSSATSWDPSPNGAVRALRTVGNTFPTIYVGGEFTSIAGVARGYLASFSGASLRSWNPNPSAAVYTIYLSGSNLYVGGLFGSIGGVARAFAGAVSTTTAAAAPWDPKANYPVRAFGQSGNTMWLGGEFTSLGSVARSNLAALDLTTGTPTSWNPGANGPVYALETIGGLLYAGGSFNTVAGLVRHNIVQLDAAGNVGNWHPDPNDQVLAITGRAADATTNVIYFGGDFTQVTGAARNRLAAMNDLPIPDLVFWNPSANGRVTALATDGSNVWASGTFTTINGLSRPHLAKIGVFDGLPTAWNPGVQSAALGLALTPGTIYAGFSGPWVIGGVTRYGIAELDKNTAQATAWNPVCNDLVYTIHPSGGTVYVGGVFVTIGGQPRANIAALDAVTGQATPWNPTAKSFESVLGFAPALPLVADFAESNGRIYAAGQFTAILDKPHSGIAGIFASTVDVPSPALPGGVALRAMPNPSGGGQALQFNLAAGGFARVAIHDVSGRVVRVLHEGALPAGPQRLEWDGLSQAGVRVGPGIYFARVDTGAEHATAKLLRVNR